MAKLPQSIPRSALPVQMSIYADDICLWVSGIYKRQIYHCIQEAINATEGFLVESGLALSQEKAACMAIRGNERRFPQADVTLAGSKIKQVHKQRFLGIIHTRQLKWAQAVKAVMDVCRPAANAISCMTGTSWGCSERTLAAAHRALVASRALYRLPYMTPSQADRDKLEWVQKCGLRTAMGVPQAAGNEAVLREMGVDPFLRQAAVRQLQQLTRLSTSTASRWLLTRLQDQKESRWRTVIGEFLDVASPLPAVANDARVAPWEVAEIPCEIKIEHLIFKKAKPPLLAKSAVEYH
ncbi:uncharacterized protein LOC120842635 [Ixodes scapularis]|uniref:uncharacterized protein LOC120842635 n=1 Tax=Ixodes scapularis TaxID=6945 RepID=UPI001A9DE115|nr:uncharacterized protein LOC120842635 [Ixodes scapularis]